MKSLLSGLLAGTCLLMACTTPTPGVGPTPQPTVTPSKPPTGDPSLVAPVGETKLTRGAQCEQGSVWVLPKDEVIAVAPCVPPESQPAYIQPAATRQISAPDREKAQARYPALSVQAAPERLGSLIPDLPLATGQLNQCSTGDGVVFQGGLLGSCRQYLVQEDEPAQSFRLLKDAPSFQSYFAPIASPAEAASYAIARSGASWKSEFPELKDSYRYYARLIRRSRVEAKGDGYEVLLYAFQQFGCGPHGNYAVTYQVGRDGSFSEIARTLAWTDPMLDGLCVD